MKTGQSETGGANVKKLLLLGNNLGYQEVIDYVHKRGDCVIVTDNLTGEQSHAKKMADISWNISTLDVDALYQKAKSEGIDGVLATTGERNIESAITLAEKMDLPFYVSSDTWKLFHDKIRFKEVCRTHGLPVSPDFTEDRPPEEKDFPVIVKPADNCFSRGVSICRKPEELPEACSHARKFSETGRIVIERYIEGVQLSIHYHMVDGVVEFTDLAEFYREEGKDVFGPSVTVSPASCLDSYMKLYDSRMRAMLKAAGCRNGVTFFQAIVENHTGNLYFIENNYRLDGVGIFRLQNLALGVDAVKIITDISLDGRTDFRPVPVRRDKETVIAQYCIWGFGKCRIGEISGLEENRTDRTYILQKYQEGDLLGQNGENGDMILGFGIWTDGMDELIARIRTINKTVAVYDENGADILERYENPEQIRTV